MPEAIWDLTANEFGPLIVGMDTHGNSIYDRIRNHAAKVLDELYPAD
jgi:fumarate hydratase subunit beta/L(+)-tartrate dehydratase beta subunit